MWLAVLLRSRVSHKNGYIHTKFAKKRNLIQQRIIKKECKMFSLSSILSILLHIHAKERERERENREEGFYKDLK